MQGHCLLLSFVIPFYLQLTVVSLRTDTKSMHHLMLCEKAEAQDKPWRPQPHLVRHILGKVKHTQEVLDLVALHLKASTIISHADRHTIHASPVRLNNYQQIYQISGPGGGILVSREYVQACTPFSGFCDQSCDYSTPRSRPPPNTIQET